MTKEKSQIRFTQDSIKDPEVRKEWLRQGRESALQLVEALKQGVRENVRTP